MRHRCYYLKVFDSKAYTDPKISYEWAVYGLKGRFLDGERVIGKDARFSYFYALRILKGRFVQGESAMSIHEYFAYHYAHDILKGRFLLGEDAIAKNSNYASKYARLILKERFKKAEGVICRSRHWKKYLHCFRSEKNDICWSVLREDVNNIRYISRPSRGMQEFVLSVNPALINKIHKY